LEDSEWFRHALDNHCYQQTARSVREILGDPKYSEKGRLLRQGQKAFSQCDEDGIIAAIFARIGAGTKVFVEIGADNGLENNTRALLYDGWSGYWIEAKQENTASAFEKFKEFVPDRLKICTAFVTTENIQQIFRDGQVPGEFDLLSIDIDGNDYYIFEALKDFNPRVVVIEYNAKYPSSTDRVQKYDAKYIWDFADDNGASLKALERIFSKHGYSLVGCNLSGANAFFVRNDLLAEHFCQPFTAENHYQPRRYWLVDWYFSGSPDLKYE
jgi:hypothetical protein